MERVSRLRRCFLIMSRSVKFCQRCLQPFSRPRKLSAAQWQRRLFCSRRCAATRVELNSHDLFAEYSSGKSAAEIAASAGISDTHVKRLIVGAGHVLRSASEAQRLSKNNPATRAKISAAATGRMHGDPAKDKLRARIGSKNARWRDGITITSGGYIAFTASKANGEHAGKFLHKVLAEWKIGRKIDRGEHVHHVDGDKLNNHPDNIIVLTASEHARLHSEKRKCIASTK